MIQVSHCDAAHECGSGSPARWPKDRQRFSARLGIDVDVDPFAEQDRMRLVADHPITSQA
jgi:hypothetical protein